MAVIVEASGRRSVRVEVEVPGTVEEAWRAIATEEGVLSWFVPAEFELDAAGHPKRIVWKFGPGMESVSTVLGWDPPRGFRSESSDFVEEGAPVTTEWRVEEAAGGGCVVRVEHSLYIDSDERDAHLLGVEAGWPSFFRILRAYMTHFRGQPCTQLELHGTASIGTEAWKTLAQGLGCACAKAGDYREAPAESLRFAGTVDYAPDDSELIVRLDQPTSGVAHLYAMPADDIQIISVRLYLYGEDAAEVVAHEQPRWQAWMEARFPSGAE